jgi:hypothetical protein
VSTRSYDARHRATSKANSKAAPLLCRSGPAHSRSRRRDVRGDWRRCGQARQGRPATARAPPVPRSRAATANSGQGNGRRPGHRPQHGDPCHRPGPDPGPGHRPRPRHRRSQRRSQRRTQGGRRPGGGGPARECPELANADQETPRSHPASAGAGGACTQARTSRSRRAPTWSPCPPARWSLPAWSRDTATWSRFATGMALSRSMDTCRASRPPQAKRSRGPGRRAVRQHRPLHRAALTPRNPPRRRRARRPPALAVNHHVAGR